MAEHGRETQVYSAKLSLSHTAGHSSSHRHSWLTSYMSATLSLQLFRLSCRKLPRYIGHRHLHAGMLNFVVLVVQWIPPHERAKAVSLSTSGMYLGSAAGMLVLPSIAARAGPGALLKFVGGLGFAWLAFWIVVGREVPHR